MQISEMLVFHLDAALGWEANINLISKIYVTLGSSFSVPYEINMNIK